SGGGGDERFGGRENYRSPPNEYEYGGGQYRGEGGMRKTRSYGDVNEVSGNDDRRIVTVTPLRDMKPE
ncbi:putative clathrin assembly plant-like protein, partial [Trifolium medium]|nr:putative clathrin assembly plant-like protein [Trifolium medium]